MAQDHVPVKGVEVRVLSTAPVEPRGADALRGFSFEPRLAQEASPQHGVKQKAARVTAIAPGVSPAWIRDRGEHRLKPHPTSMTPREITLLVEMGEAAAFADLVGEVPAKWAAD